jgi:hypothetical protein
VRRAWKRETKNNRDERDGTGKGTTSLPHGIARRRPILLLTSPTSSTSDGLGGFIHTSPTLHSVRRSVSHQSSLRIQSADPPELEQSTFDGQQADALSLRTRHSPALHPLSRTSSLRTTRIDRHQHVVPLSHFLTRRRFHLSTIESRPPSSRVLDQNTLVGTRGGALPSFLTHSTYFGRHSLL